MEKEINLNSILENIDLEDLLGGNESYIKNQIIEALREVSKQTVEICNENNKNNGSSFINKIVNKYSTLKIKSWSI